jgi:hypothetical protein
MTQAGFAAEVYLPREGPDGFPAVALRSRAAAREMALEGIPISYRGAVLLAEDEMCFFLFDAPSAEVVREASRRAGVPFDRVVAADADAAPELSAVGGASPNSMWFSTISHGGETS